jgi:hypothetical protein
VHRGQRGCPAETEIRPALAHLKALGGKTGQVFVGPGPFIEKPLIRPPGASIIGAGWKLTEIKMEAAANGNVLQDEAWGNTNSVNEGGLIDHLVIDGNKVNQTATIAPESLVTTVQAISGTPETLTVVSTTGFAESGNLWVGINRCAYTGKTGTSFTGVTCATSFSATVEMLVVPFGGVGNGIAIQSSRSIVGDDVVCRQCVGSGIALQGSGGSGYAYECEITAKRCEQNGRYDLEIMPHATDGMCSHWVGSASGLGTLFVGGGDWKFSQIHPIGAINVGTGALARQLIRICASQQNFESVFFDHAPYDCVRVDTLAYNQAVNDITFEGETYLCSFASASAGSGICLYGNNSTTGKSERLNINFACVDHVFNAFNFYPRSQLVGQQNLEAPPEGKVQVLSVLEFCPLGSSAGGTIAVTGSGTLAYAGVSAVGTYLTEEASIGATVLKLNSTSGLAAAGIVTVNVNYASGKTTALRVAYTGISGNELTGGTGVTEAVANGNGVAQHFLTGVTGGTGKTVADATTMQQAGRTAKPSGCAHFRIEKNNGTPGGQSPPIRVTWVETASSTVVNYNPFFGSVKVEIGATEGVVAHNLHTTPNYVTATPLGDPQQRWWVTSDGTNVTVHLASKAEGSAVSFSVVARATSA